MDNAQHKTALLFTYYWPPASGPGVQRWLKFVKFLPEYGWNVIVVTPKNSSYPNTDPSLISDIPNNTRVETTGTLEPFRLFNLVSGNSARGKQSSVGMGDIKGEPSFIKNVAAYIRANFFIPDARVGWVPFAYRRGKKLISDTPVDLIITTGPPHSSHKIGSKLSKKYQIPWIADFRDPWTNIYYNAFLPRTSFSQKKDRTLENATLSQADYSIVVSNGIKREFENRARKIAVIPNGYDEEDFNETIRPPSSSVFRLEYIGNFKLNQNCKELWEAIDELRAEDDVFSKQFRLSFTGNIHDEVLQSIQAHGIDDLLETHAFVEHKEAVKKMCKANALLFPIPNSPNNEQIITGKIFEYLASQTPLLSIGPVKGNASAILKECNRANMIDYENKEAIKNRLKELIEHWKAADKSTQIENRNHERYARKSLAKSLVNVFNEVI